MKITVDSGICARKNEKTIIIPAQIVASDGTTYCDNGREITNKQMLDDSLNCYRTSSPLLGDYEDIFRSILDEGEDVIHLSMSSGISEGSVNAATMMANDLNAEYENKVYVIDSLTGATGGTLFYELAYQKLISGEFSTQEMVEYLEELKHHIQTSFYVPNAEGYIRSGRDKSKYVRNALTWSAKIASLAALKFRVDFNEDGNLFFKKMFRSQAKSGMLNMIRDIVNKDTIEAYDKRLAVVGNLYQDKVDMNELVDYLKSFDYFDDVINHEIGSVVAAYGCHDLCGIALVKKTTHS